MKQAVTLSDGTILPAIGQGTWRMGDDPSKRKQEIASLRIGIELGMSVIDTAEMYGEGLSEELVGEAISHVRDQVFLVSKVYPHNAGLNRITRSCEQSLKRLQTDRLDLYLLHWRGGIPLEETIEGMEQLVESGKILRWGVSNLDITDMKELIRLSKGTNCMINQVMYHLGSRGIEYDLLPWQRENSIPIMAYSPLAQAGILRRGLIQNSVVQEISLQRNIDPYQLLLAWSIREKNVLAIPKAAHVEHVKQNAAAAQIELTSEELIRLDQAFPSPSRKMPLDII